MPSPTRVRWFDRIVGVVIGSIATAWWLRPEPVPAQTAGTTAAAAVDAPVSHATTREDAAAVGASEGPHLLRERATEPRADDPAPLAAESPREAEPLPDTPAQPETAPPTDLTPVPAVPLPRMPGDTRLSSTSRFDDETRSWILKTAYRVHARDHHVVAFYRKALADEGLAVTQSEDPPRPDGAVKTYLHGKNARTHAQVGIMPRVGALETRVWILWRTRS